MQETLLVLKKLAGFSELRYLKTPVYKSLDCEINAVKDLKSF